MFGLFYVCLLWDSAVVISFHSYMLPNMSYLHYSNQCPIGQGFNVHSVIACAVCTQVLPLEQRKKREIS